MGKIQFEVIHPSYIRGRYGWHKLIPILENENKIDFAFPCEYLRIIGNDMKFPEAIDPDGGPFMTLESTIMDQNHNKFKIDKFDNSGKYVIIECTKLPYSITTKEE